MVADVGTRTTVLDAK
jgi:hypothetical protein